MLYKLTSADLYNAVQNNELFLLYQPIIRLDNGDIAYLEALLRWNHPGQGIIPPIVFLPLVEETSLIPTISDWVLEAGCLTLSKWQKTRLDLKIGINLSSIYFDQESAESKIFDVLKKFNISPSNLVIEVTETASFAHKASLFDVLKSKGVKIALDDFGMGFSCVSNLEAISPDFIKISDFLISRLNGISRADIITKALINLAHDLDVDIVAEGVETKEQKDLLIKNACDAIQGYFYYKPMTTEETTDFLNKKNDTE